MVATAFTLLRDRYDWYGRKRGLAVQAGGALSLQRVPAPADGQPIELPATYPYARVGSGIAPGSCGALFVADTEHDRILVVDRRGAVAWLPGRNQPVIDAPGHFSAPRGLAVGPDVVLVADQGHGALQSLALPRLEPNDVLRGAWAPLALARDTAGNVLVVDARAPRLLRLSTRGAADTAFNTRAAGVLGEPFSVALAANERVLVSDTAADTVFVLDRTGARAGELTGPLGWKPGALAARGERAYVADAASGAIFAFVSGELAGQVGCWRGPVSALAVAEQGDLLIKPGLDARYFVFAAGAAHVAEGELVAGPFDAGEMQAWERVRVDADVPPGTRLDVDVALAADPAAPPVWQALPTPDSLLGATSDRDHRFVSVRLRLYTASPAVAPRVQQARCATAAEDYLDYLPLAYRRSDQAGFLARWLKLLRTEFGRVEEEIDLLCRLADPAFVPTGSIAWLADWLALELPQVADEDEARLLISRAVALGARRGTPDSIAGWVELHTGIRPAIVEEFESRRIWVLGKSSRLGFDTRLPAQDPAGMIVPDTDATGCPGPMGSVVVGATGPLAVYQVGLPLRRRGISLLRRGGRLSGARSRGARGGAPDRRPRETGAHRILRRRDRAGDACRPAGAHRHRCDRRRRAARCRPGCDPARSRNLAAGRHRRARRTNPPRRRADPDLNEERDDSLRQRRSPAA